MDQLLKLKSGRQVITPDFPGDEDGDPACDPDDPGDKKERNGNKWIYYLRQHRPDIWGAMSRK